MRTVPWQRRRSECSIYHAGNLQRWMACKQKLLYTQHIQKSEHRVFPFSSKTPCSQCRGRRFNP